MDDQLALEARALVEEHGPRPEWDHNYRLIDMVDRLRMALETSESKLDAETKERESWQALANETRSRLDAALKDIEGQRQRRLKLQTVLDDAQDKADRFDRAEVWAQKVEIENSELRSRVGEVSRLLDEWRDPAGSRMIHREFAVAVLEKALAVERREINSDTIKP